MPSPKQDKTEIWALRKSRPENDEYDPHDHPQKHINELVQAVCGEGFITTEGVNRLALELPALVELRPYLPNTTLLNATLRLQRGDWTPDNEEAFLRLCTAGFLDDDYGHLGDELRDLFEEPNPFLGDIYAELFDNLTDHDALQGRFVQFTGSFVSGSRRSCWDTVRKLSGVPVEAVYDLDYLFVANTHINNRIVSSKIEAAINIRSRRGQLKILRESDWNQLTASVLSQSTHD
ncbi:hypothetical protein [Atopomonas sediminilitoris]|uniref:hypothetical protein n=1 Tax=Atopomonas sediminilitoris TaxID=2919919 RepID=UPI001F4E183D|nr:hypothetical protein [Atopomonas sediminilitoris]MCJ8168632.1 hypothetical protein [Atopomonas sediminilitoris]